MTECTGPFGSICTLYQLEIYIDFTIEMPLRGPYSLIHVKQGVREIKMVENH